MLIDTHSHLNFKNFEKDYAQVIERSLNYDLKAIINVGSDFKTSKKAIEIASRYKKGVYATVGLHPIYINQKDFDFHSFKELATSEKVIAIGETGLDYYRNEAQSEKAKQKEVFLKQTELAYELNLPIILHCRSEKDDPLKAYKEMIEILQNFIKDKNLKGVIHCFQANWKMAKEFIKLGFYLGFTGFVTFTKDEKLIEVVKKIPLDRILLETDCPFLSPIPYRGKRCEPWYVKFIAEKIAEIKKLSFQKIAKATTQNAEKLFLSIIFQKA